MQYRHRNHPNPNAPAQTQSLQEALDSLTDDPFSAPPQASFSDALAEVNLRDSDAALAMYDWLVQTGRLQTVGTLTGGGYLLHYSEPKGATKAGYTPGGTQGGRMVDQAVAKAKEAGIKPRQAGLCDQCFSAVVKLDDGSIVLDDASASAICHSTAGEHTFNA